MTSQTVTGTPASTTPDCVVGPLVPLVSQSLAVFPTSPTLTEQIVTGASALIAPFCDVDADCPLDNPSAAAAWSNSPTALSCAVIGALTLARPPVWLRPTDVVEQLLPASATTPTESEQALMGASALATGDDCPAVFVPVVVFRPGSTVLPTTFDLAVTGAATSAFGVAEAVACAAAVAAACCTARTVACRSVGDGVAAPAGTTPTTAPAARMSPPVRTPMDVNRFLFKVLLLLCAGTHTCSESRRSPPIRGETRNRWAPCEGALEL